MPAILDRRRDEDEDESDAALHEARRTLRAKRARRARTMFFVKLGAILAGILAIALVVRYGTGRTSKPEATAGKSQSDNRSAPVSAHPAPVKGDDTSVPATDFPPADWTHRELQNHLLHRGLECAVSNAGTTDGVIWAFFERRTGAPASITVGLCRNPTHAREVRGGQGDRAAAMGRFVFYPTPNADFVKERANVKLLLDVGEVLIER